MKTAKLEVIIGLDGVEEIAVFDTGSSEDALSLLQSWLPLLFRERQTEAQPNGAI